MVTFGRQRVSDTFVEEEICDADSADRVANVIGEAVESVVEPLATRDSTEAAIAELKVTIDRFIQASDERERSRDQRERERVEADAARERYRDERERYRDERERQRDERARERERAWHSWLEQARERDRARDAANAEHESQMRKIVYGGMAIGFGFVGALMGLIEFLSSR